MAKGYKTGGRQKGTPNKVTRTIREAWAEAFELVNQRVPLHEWGAANPEKFYPLATKLIPQEHHGTFDIRALRDLSDDELEAQAKAAGLE